MSAAQLVDYPHGIADEPCCVAALHCGPVLVTLTSHADGSQSDLSPSRHASPRQGEGYEGHGVFTWALLDALKNGDRNGNGTIELSELVAHVQDQVPRIAAKVNGIGRAAIAVRGLTDGSQSARFGSKGEDFVLARQLK